MSDVDSITESLGEAVDTVTLALLMASGIPMRLLDAGSMHYANGRRIPGSKYLPINCTDSELQSVAGSRDALIVVCSNGHDYPAREALCSRLKELGYEHVVEYPDGIAGWMSAGFPVEDASE